MMKIRVGIYQGPEKTYSNEWFYAENYSEKRAIRALSDLMGCPNSNLFNGIVKPGDRVVIKPNWVLDKHPYGFDIFSVITHPAVLRAVVDLVYEVLKGEGQIIIADAPQWDCDFENILRVTQVHRISEYYWEKFRFEIPIRDLRQVRCVSQNRFIKSADRVQLPGDPEGYAVVDLGSDSAFTGMPHPEKLYGADYDRRETIRHHNAGRHEYLVSKTILNADVLIHVPKLKVHKKVGVTLNAKGMVGINGNKNWVAHFRIGPPSLGGDEFPDEEPAIAKTKARMNRLLIDHLLSSQSPVRERVFDLIYRAYCWIKPILGDIAKSRVSVDGGNWYGNDTAWRMVADLARIVLYADRDGRIQDTVQRRFFSVVDGIIGGEKEGPLAPIPKPCGVLIAGDNLLAVDLVGTRLMGFDWRKVKYLRWLVEDSPHPMGVKHPETDIEICSNIPEWVDMMKDPQVRDLDFEPHPGWRGYIELKS
jgi:uncharacterized protein (DUF362 family)